MTVVVPFGSGCPFLQIIYLSFSYLDEVGILYFTDEDMGSSEVLADLLQVTVGGVRAGRKVCLMPKSLFFTLPVVFVLASF